MPGTPKEILAHKLFYGRLHLNGFISTLFARAKCGFWNVKVGKKVKFYGLPFIYKFPGSDITIGDGVRVRSSFGSNLIGLNHRSIFSTHSAAARISIGNNSGFSGVSIGAIDRIEIGDNVLVGANTLITDFDWHPVNTVTRHSGTGKGSPVRIENNVFIGYGTTILKGVSIGENSVIGANSVVAIDIPANSLAGGNPCKVIKTL